MIKLVGIEEFPRYRVNEHIIGEFNCYLTEPFYRYVIMQSIKEPFKFRNVNSIIEDSIEEALIMIDPPSNLKELPYLKNLIESFISSQTNMEKHRGTLFEQCVRFLGPSYFEFANEKGLCSLEEAQIFCESLDYHNSDGQKNVDVIFFEEHTRIKVNNFEVVNFIACEVKCNINTFVTSIIKSTKQGNSLTENSNYNKLLYLNEMSQLFKNVSKVFICTLKETNVYVKEFLKKHGLDSIAILEPI